MGDDTAALVVVCTGTIADVSEHARLSEGPLPFEYTDSRGRTHRADAAWRGGQFHPNIAPLLYQPRWHRDHRNDPLPGPAGTRIRGVEVLGPPPALDDSGWLLVVLHLEPAGSASILDCLRDLVPGHQPSDGEPAETITRLLGPGITLVTDERIVTCSHVGFTEGAPVLTSEPDSVPPAQQWARSLASLNEAEGVIFHGEDPDWTRGDGQPVSGQYLSVLRDGIGTVFEGTATRPTWAARAAGAASIFSVDMLLLATMQRLGIQELDDRLAAMSRDFPRLRDGIGSMEMALLRFRNEVWWEEVSPARPANVMIRTLQDQHHLARRLEQLRADVADSARIVENHELRFTNDLLGLLTIASVVVGLPAAVVLGAAALVREPAAGLAWIAMLVFFALAFAGGAGLFVWHSRRRRVGSDRHRGS